MFKPIASTLAGLFIPTIVGTLTVAASMVAFSSEAHAWVKVCNKTSEPTFVAYGYNYDDEFTFRIGPASKRSKGWWNLKTNECATVDTGSASSVVDGKVSSIYGPYYYAQSNSYIWAGTSQFCVNYFAPFALTTTGTCPVGYDSLGLRKINSGANVNYTINLVEPTVIQF
jgi:uncharacterized membrane protein